MGSNKGKIGSVDTLANVTYSLGVGALTDFWSGLNALGVLSSRLSSVPLNIVTGSPYALWTEKLYSWTKTKKESSQSRKFLVDLLAFNTFQVPVYGVALAVGSVCSQTEVDWKKVESGMTHLAQISPFIAPTLRMYTNSLRKIFGIKSISEGAYRNEREEAEDGN
ncbi:MAG: L-alanine exporter AlaE [Nanoarchaeota archaeon]